MSAGQKLDYTKLDYKYGAKQMSELIKIFCDNCSNEITYSYGCQNYCLKLSNHTMPNYSSITCDIMIYPPIDSTKHFCGLGCLKKWLEAK